MIKEDGNVRFFGATSTIAWPMIMQDGMEHEPSTQRATDPFNDHPTTFESIVQEFPLTSSADPIQKSAMMDRAVAQLPPRELATTLVDCYYLRASWQ